MLFKRKDSANWWCKFTISGRETRCSTGTSVRKDAEEFETKLRNRVWRERKLREPEHTWDEAFATWLEESSKRSLAKDKFIIRWLRPHLGSMLLRDTTAEFLTDLRNKKAAETSKSNANRTMALVRAILRWAVDRGMLNAAPKIRLFEAEQPEPMWVTREQFAALVSHLKPLQAEIARFAVSTGLRRSNITHLTWERVDLDRRMLWIPGKSAKAKKTIGIPLSQSAVDVLRRRLGKHSKWVFELRGKPIVQTSTRAWRVACIKAGIPGGFRFHDLRHTWASWHVQAGTSLRELQELGAWASYQMVLRYAHLNPSHLAEAAQRIDIETGRKRVQ